MTGKGKQAPHEQPIVVRLTMRRLKWPEAEEPEAIQLLRRTLHVLSRIMVPDKRAALIRDIAALTHDIDKIVQVWDAQGNLDHLRDQLGLKRRGRGRRRTPHQINRALAMAVALAEHKARGTANPLEAVIEEFGCDERTVQRAMNEHGEQAKDIVRFAREKRPRATVHLDYSILKPGWRKK